MSLFQKGPNGEERTEVELTVFKKSLSNMMEWYAHPKMYTFKLTAAHPRNKEPGYISTDTLKFHPSFYVRVRAALP